MGQLVNTVGLPLMFVIITLETIGLPVPGETALIATAVLAQRGHFDITVVIAVAATAASVGGIGGYLVGRLGGRELIERWRALDRFQERVLPASERFFRRHGAKTVFVARFLPLIRMTASWLAGISRMSLVRFALWNTGGSILWAIAIGLLAYYVGAAVGTYGLAAGLGLLVVVSIALTAQHYWRRRLLRSGAES
jgi:membrane protein DedA with SNARE-associated domain